MVNNTLVSFVEKLLGPMTALNLKRKSLIKMIDKVFLSQKEGYRVVYVTGNYAVIPMSMYTI